jgi:hypothetical protein
MSRKAVFYILILSGIAFIIIGTLSVYDSNIAKPVSINGIVNSHAKDILTPIMEVGSKAQIGINGSRFDFTISDPVNVIVLSVKNKTNFSYNLIAKSSGEYRLETHNLGSQPLSIFGYAETKASPLAFGAQMMLIITGIVVVGLGIRSKIV